VILAAFALGCAPDLDGDGVERALDCDDDDPFVYPGAPDGPGDGVDADCDGEDPGFPWIGAWVVADFFLEYSGIGLVLPGTTTGRFEVDDDFGALQFTASLDPSYIGYELTLPFAFTGDVSSTPDGDTMAFYGTGDLFGEVAHVDWTCTADGVDLGCDGELKALETSINSDARFESEPAEDEPAED
jgi:hypothetical protein